MVKILCLPILPHKTPSFEITTCILMLFLTLDLYFDPRASITPLFHGLFMFFLSSFLCHFPILIFEPCLFNLLLMHVICGVVVEEVRLSFESILSLKDYWFPSTVELCKWVRNNRSLLLFKLRLHLCTNVSHPLRSHST